MTPWEQRKRQREKTTEGKREGAPTNVEEENTIQAPNKMPFFLRNIRWVSCGRDPGKTQGPPRRTFFSNAVRSSTSWNDDGALFSAKSSSSFLSDSKSGDPRSASVESSNLVEAMASGGGFKEGRRVEGERQRESEAPAATEQHKMYLYMHCRR